MEQQRKIVLAFDILRSREEGLWFNGIPDTPSPVAPHGLTPSPFSCSLDISTGDVSARLFHSFA